MRIEKEKVELFMERIGDQVSDRPTCVSVEAAQRRYFIIHEELDEYKAANDVGDIVGVADACGDLLYTVLGLAVLHGLPVQEIFDEVHRSNMTKDPVKGSHKLCVKGPSFSKPRIAEVIFNAQHLAEPTGV